jgi:chemotaxis protein methyltransferase CheR
MDVESAVKRSAFTEVDVDLEIDLLLEAIFRRYQHDFRHYTRSSIRRRVLRARDHFQVATIAALTAHILHDEQAFGELMGFLTIGVTDLFREPASFVSLRQTVAPVLATYPSLKVWVAGCATGEEVYSLVILFAEIGLLDRTLFYATDINPSSLHTAERGIYDLTRAADFSRAYQAAGGTRSLSDYYTAGYGAITFHRELRKKIVFSDHSLATDHVFCEVHLVTCRNVLMYFDRRLQDRAVGLFGEALIRKGFLSLGTRETLLFCSHREEFEEIDRRQRIYQKRAGVAA